MCLENSSFDSSNQLQNTFWKCRIDQAFKLTITLISALIVFKSFSFIFNTVSSPKELSLKMTIYIVI